MMRTDFKSFSGFASLLSFSASVRIFLLDVFGSCWPACTTTGNKRGTDRVLVQFFLWLLLECRRSVGQTQLTNVEPLNSSLFSHDRVAFVMTSCVF